MRKIVFSALLGTSLALAGCATTQSVTGSAVYSAKLAFDGAVKTFNAFKAACVAKALPASCRGYVVQGQGIVAKAYAYERAANAVALSAAVSELAGVIGAMQSLRQ